MDDIFILEFKLFNFLDKTIVDFHSKQEKNENFLLKFLPTTFQPIADIFVQWRKTLDSHTKFSGY